MSPCGGTFDRHITDCCGFPVVLRERFYLAAADQQSGTRGERLKEVIQAKYEAGLLKPYDYAGGYARMFKWLEKKSVINIPLKFGAHTHSMYRTCPCPRDTVSRNHPFKLFYGPCPSSVLHSARSPKASVTWI